MSRHNPTQKTMTAKKKLWTALSSSRPADRIRRSLSTQAAEGVAPTTIAFGSCSDPQLDLSYWDRIRNTRIGRPDLMLFLGDIVYPRNNKTNDQSLTQVYQTMAKHPSVRRFFDSGIPILPILDDNDYHDDNGATTNQNHHDMDYSNNLFLEFFRVDATDERRIPGRGAYCSRRWGDQLEIIVLDVRRHATPFRRKTQTTNNNRHSLCGPYEPCHDTTSTLLGLHQWQWLEEICWQGPPVRQRILVSPIQVLPTGHGWDGWHLFPHEQTRLLDLLSGRCSSDNNRGSPPVILLSGDRHFGACYHFQSSSRGRNSENDSTPPKVMTRTTDFWEVTSSSLTHSIPHGLCDGEWDEQRQVKGPIYENNFGVLELNNNHNGDQESNSISISWHSAQTGKVIDHVKIPCIDK